MKRHPGFCSVLCLLLAVPLVFGCSSDKGKPYLPADVADTDYVTTKSGLKYFDLEVGDGPSPRRGQSVVVHYTGWLTDGKIFDSSIMKQRPFSFAVGGGQVIRGWDEGVATMKVGGKRQLVIPPDLAYGDGGAGNVIPPEATLTFQVELLEIKD